MMLKSKQNIKRIVIVLYICQTFQEDYGQYEARIQIIGIVDLHNLQR